MIFVDSNIPMYLIGADHPHKRDAVNILERLISEKARLVTSVEVYQEILHRYASINKRDAIQTAFDALDGFIDKVFDVTQKDVTKAKDLLLAYTKLSARDALHAAIMTRNKIKIIFSFDMGFDQIPTLQRIS